MPDRLTYVGHATVSIELGGTRLLTDPALRHRFLHIRRHSAPPAAEAIADIDGILISHLHLDHLDLPSLGRLGTDLHAVVPHGGERLLRRRGFDRVEAVAPGDETRIGSVEVVVTPAEHKGQRLPILPHRKAVGYDLRGPERRIYFAGDTDLFPQMAELAGGVDVALLPIAGWGPHLRHGHLDPEKAVTAAERIKPRIVVPIHWGTFMRAGLARRRPGLLSDPPRELVALMSERLPEVEVRVLGPGQSLELG